MGKNRDFSKFPNAITVLDNGNVGIGTTTFSEGTQPTGTLSFIPNSSVSSGPLIQLAGNGRIRPASTSDRLSIDGNALFLNSTIGGDIIMNTAGGKVGIGISNPTFLLSVNSATDIWHMALGDTSSTGKMVRIGGYGQSGVYGVIGAYSGHTNSSAIPLILQRDGSSVAIGTTNPSGTFTVSNAQSLSVFKSTTTTNYAEVQIENTTNYLQIGVEGGSGNRMGGTIAYNAYLGSYNNYGMTFHTNNQNRMTITNGGQVTISSQPSFAAYKNNNEEPGSNTILSYENATINRGNCYNTSNSRFTAPVAGVYAFGVKVWFKTNSTGTIWVLLRKNGASYTEQRMSMPVAAANYTTFFPKWVVPLAAGDYIEVSGYGDNSNFHSSQSEYYSQFYGHLLH